MTKKQAVWYRSYPEWKDGSNETAGGKNFQLSKQLYPELLGEPNHASKVQVVACFSTVRFI